MCGAAGAHAVRRHLAVDWRVDWGCVSLAQVAPGAGWRACRRVVNIRPPRRVYYIRINGIPTAAAPAPPLPLVMHVLYIIKQLFVVCIIKQQRAHTARFPELPRKSTVDCKRKVENWTAENLKWGKNPAVRALIQENYLFIILRASYTI